MASLDAEPGSGDLTVYRRDGVAVIAIARPQKRNAMTTPMLGQLREILAAEASGESSAVVLTGSDEVFSAGMDLNEIGRGEEDLAIDDAIAGTAAAIRSLPIPVVAAVEGPCVGAAVELALACDVRIAGAGSYFSLPAAKLGALYRPDGISDIVATVGRQTAARLLVLGDRIPADEAVQSGIVARVVPEGTAAQEATTLASRVTGSVAAAVAATKELIAEIAALDSPDLARWDERRSELVSSPERSAAVDSARGTSGEEAESQA